MSESNKGQSMKHQKYFFYTEALWIIGFAAGDWSLRARQ